MSLQLQILIALGLDLLLGDPRWLPHPIRLIGRVAATLEAPLRRTFSNPRLAGVAAVLAVVGSTAMLAYALVTLAGRLHPLAGDALSIFLLYTTLASRDLMLHSHQVYRALVDGDLPAARQRVGWMVGRDTDQLDEPGVVRAAVESVAENLVDGVTAPLLFAALAGPVGALAYKAVNTLDSLFGYRNERYRDFGWASARLDDLVNYLPARLTAPLVPLAAALLGLHPRDSWRVLWRDRHNHTSPNAGLTEAAFAGALGVQLGGLNHYQGQPSQKPTLGDPGEGLEPAHILSANNLMLVTTSLAAALFLSLLGGIP